MCNSFYISNEKDGETTRMAISDSDIILAMREQAETGFRLLMAKYKEPLYWHIRRLVVSHDDAQDVTQEVFVRIFRSFSQCKDEQAFTAWVYRIATNEALRLLSRHKEERFSLDSSEINAVGIMADEYVDYADLESVKLQKAILSLPPKQQVVFNLRYYDELGYEEIAEITESTAVNVKANYHIAKNKIIEYMNTHD